MEEKDFKPNYLEVTVAYLKQFVLEFFDQNPISLLGFVATREGLATTLTELSGNLREHLNALEEIRDLGQLKGEPSLQNSLELVSAMLSYVSSLMAFL
jgi:transcription initiation factor TFIIH subunit 2